MTDDQQPQQNNDQLSDLLAQLKAASKDELSLFRQASDREKQLMDQIRAHGDAAIEPLIAYIADLLEEVDALAQDRESDYWYYAYVHATDILGDLSLTRDHVQRLFALQAQHDEDDLYNGQIVESLGRLGSVAVEPALEILRNRELDQYYRITAADTLGQVAKAHPDLRERIADELVAFMSGVAPEDEDYNDWGVNVFTLMALGETRQVQHIPFIEQMFAAGRVDEMVCDVDWVRDEIQGIDPMARRPKPDFAGIERLINKMPGAVDSEPDNPPPPRREQSPKPIIPGYFDPFETYYAPERPGRNDPCWCGSGKKYKHCHLKDDQQKDREQ